MKLAKSFLTIVFAMMLCVGASLAVVMPVQAQSNDNGAPVGGAVPGNTTSGSASDSEIWRQIRQGGQGTVVGHNPKAGLMIQSQGEDWRQIRDGVLPMYSAWAITGMLILLCLFYAIRGRVKISHGRSDRTVTRFSLIERGAHWLLASSFIILAITGLNLVFGKELIMPVFGKEFFASFTEFGKFVHNYVGFAFMVSLAVIAVMWIAHNLPSRHDITWFLKGGGLIGLGHPPAKKFNAGQKIIFWTVILCGVSISLSGWALLNPFETTMMADTAALANNVLGTSFAVSEIGPIQEQQLQTLWHSIMAVVMIVIVVAHIYIGSVGMEGALDAMTSGEVDENWAMEHHSLWVEEMDEKNRKATGTSAQPAE